MMKVSAQQLKKQRLELILLFALPVIGILLMTGYYFYVVDQNKEMGTHNKGVLVSPPKPMAELSLMANDKAFKINDGSGKWTFIVVGGASCNEACQQQLYLTRQIKEAMGKYKLRIRNVYLMNTLGADDIPDEALADLLADGYDGHQLVTVNDAVFSAWAEQEQPSLQSLPAVQFYVVDPAGWLMMYYAPEHNYKQVISDMKFLIKNS